LHRAVVVDGARTKATCRGGLTLVEALLLQQATGPLLLKAQAQRIGWEQISNPMSLASSSFTGARLVARPAADGRVDARVTTKITAQQNGSRKVRLSERGPDQLSRGGAGSPVQRWSCTSIGTFECVCVRRAVLRVPSPRRAASASVESRARGHYPVPSTCWGARARTEAHNE
jgi:hypothetical protein